VREARRFDARLETWRRPIDSAARAYARERSRSVLAELELESLKEAGAANVRWGALAQAGYRTVADLQEVSARRLAQVPGVGRKTAGSLLRAQAKLLERLAREGPRLPMAELSEAGAEELAARTLDLRAAQEAAGAAARSVRQQAVELVAGAREVERETSFGRWLAGPLRRQENAAAAQRANALAAEAEALERSGLLEEARAGRKRLAGWRAPRRERTELRREFRDRYAECCAMLDEIFGRLGLRPPRAAGGGRGGLTDEVARRVEAFPLRSAALGAILRPYQVFGAKYILAQERTILGDEMGLGKTMQTLAAMVHRAEGDPQARFFVVAPAGLLINWEREVRKFTALAPRLLYGPALEANLACWVAEGGVAITSYETLRSTDIGAVLEARGEGLDLCAVDEAHFIKNPAAGRTQAVRRLLDRAQCVVLLSGTPMENHPREFLELIDAIRPQDARELRDMDLELDAAVGSVRSFHLAVAKVYLRRNQEDVLTELPERIEIEEWVEPSPGDLAAYREKVQERNFMGMRRAATLGEVHTPSAKLERLEELLTDHRESGRKVIVFSFFLDVLAALAARFETVGTLSGKLGPQAKQDLCDAFQAHAGHAILLLQINAGGQGLNLQAASVVVLCEPQTKPSTEVQAIARAHRMGQTRRVLVHRLLARGTCDESLLTVLAQKSELFDAYARQSLVKEASSEATETRVVQAVMQAELLRLRAVEQASELRVEGALEP
jgi:superfamily II DNA or RNA helicase